MLVGRGVGDVSRLLAWDGADAAALLTEEGARPGPLRDALAAFEAAVVYSRNAALASSLAREIPRVVVHDPVPAGVHASLWLCRPLSELGIAGSEDPSDLTPSSEETAQAAPLLRELPHGFVAVHPGSGSASKNWSAPRFAELVDRLAAGERWLLVSGPADAAASASLLERRDCVVAHELAPRVLAALLSRAGVYVGNDSGVTHLAAACGAPVLAVFGPTDPELWAPVGPRVRVVRAPGADLSRLAVDVVSQAAEPMRRARS